MNSYTEYSPSQIEQRSFEIITSELESKEVVINGNIPVSSLPDSASYLAVIKRCIHTTADFDYSKTMYFSRDAISILKGLIKAGATLVTDTNMALAGINKRKLSTHGCSLYCFMSDEEVAKKASEAKTTRAHVSMEHAMGLDGPVIFVIGNAPTALMTLCGAFDEGEYEPAFIIGVPVGFVNVTASKERLIDTGIPCIVNKGRKGGSNVAAAIVNAVLYDM